MVAFLVLLPCSRGIATRACSFEQYPQSGSLAKAVCGRLIARIRAA